MGTPGWDSGHLFPFCGRHAPCGAKSTLRILRSSPAAAVPSRAPVLAVKTRAGAAPQVALSPINSAHRSCSRPRLGQQDACGGRGAATCAFSAPIACMPAQLTLPDGERRTWFALQGREKKLLRVGHGARSANTALPGRSGRAAGPTSLKGNGEAAVQWPAAERGPSKPLPMPNQAALNDGAGETRRGTEGVAAPLTTPEPGDGHSDRVLGELVRIKEHTFFLPNR